MAEAREAVGLNNTQELETVQESTEYTIDQIYSELQLHGELILVIEANAEQKLRKGLATLKAREKKKLTADGFSVEPTILEFIVHENAQVELGQVKIQIVLKSKASLKVFSKVIPDGELLT